MSVRESLRKILVCFLVMAALCISTGIAPTSRAAAEESGDRKVKYRVEPLYPEIARKLGLSGIVKLEVVVAPNGNVKETKVIGGHPILVNAALDAVKKWKFESANSESTKPLEFKFQPD